MLPACSETRLCCGVPITVEAHEPSLLEEIWKGVPSTATGGPLSRPTTFSISADPLQSAFQVALNGITLRRGLTQSEIAPFVETRIPEVVSLLSEDLVFVHAAVVGWQGEAILLPGPSWSGKTSLAMALVDAGATYYSDEFALLDCQGRTRAYPRRPALRNDTKAIFRNVLSRAITTTELAPLPVGLVLNTRYVAEEEGEDHWEPHALSPRETLFCLLANTIALRQKPELSLRALTAVSLGARAFRTRRGDARRLAHAVLDLTSMSEYKNELKSEEEYAPHYA